MLVYVDREARRAIYRELLPYLGRELSASFIQKTADVLPGIPRLHNLAQGIFKPADSAYALSIASMLKNPYADRIHYNADRSWFFDYSPKAGPLDSAVNASLFKCMRDREPVLVLKQVSDKTGPQGARYKILGLGLIERFDEASRLFRLRGMQYEAIHAYLGQEMVMDNALIDMAIELEALEDWRPFEDANRVLYRVNSQKRDQHFRRIVLRNYETACAVTGQRFQLDELAEAQAAHIIPKDCRGTDDPRNGVAMSRSVHWAFDEGLFTITDQFEVLIHEKAKRGNIRNFPLFEMDRKVIHLPPDPYNHPHAEALEWHRKERFGKFVG